MLCLEEIEFGVPTPRKVKHQSSRAGGFFPRLGIGNRQADEPAN
jgi:hypothetical protein